MKKIFARNLFKMDEGKEFSLTDVTPETYLKTMFACIEDGKLFIAEKADEVSVELAEDLLNASYVKVYVVDLSKIDVAGIIAKEQALSSICKEIAAKGEKRESALAEAKEAAERIAGGEGICMANVVNRAQRVEKLYDLDAPNLVVNNERLYLLEYLALHVFAMEYKIIEQKDFPQVFGV